jgi:glycosyltransferase involved in cell wall biosynthesis
MTNLDGPLKTQAPLVSIITPTLNRADFLTQTRLSVARQTYTNVEHIVVDGGSTDGTLDLLRSWKSHHNLRWVSDPDGGMYEAINRGLRMARGEVVAYLNSDDLYFPWTVDTIVRGFQGDARADFVYGDVVLWDTDRGQTMLHWQMPFNLDFVRRSGVLVQPAVFWRRRVLESDGLFDETLRFVADCEYWMRMGAGHRFVKVDEFLAVERNHLGTLRRLRTDAVQAELTEVRARYIRSTGPANATLLGWHRVRQALRRRYDLLRFIRASRGVRSGRRVPWRGFLQSGWFEVSIPRALGALIPQLARRHLPTVVSPRAAWFAMLDQEPPASPHGDPGTPLPLRP